MTTLTRAEAYEKHADELARFATGLVGPHEARDIVSSAMVRVLWSKQWPTVDNPRAYLYTAVLNEARMHIRASSRRRANEARAGHGGGLQHLAEARPDVVQAVGQLTVSQRAVVFLAYWEDLRPADIARRLGLSEGTVHRQLRKGQARLRRMLHE
ncbi:MAG TPA: RNA polymerase sigma factor [Acidimicrobiia bacterium]|nr:RNA polymerase sigma factor [Acidimicrobiia bacterium]